jgi:hypothetical protein
MEGHEFTHVKHETACFSQWTQMHLEWHHEK